MKSRVQTIILIVAVMAAMFGVTFIRQSVKTKDRTDGEMFPPAIEFRLSYPVTVLEGNPESELHVLGHHDFWFQNSHEQPVEIGFEKKSCKCSKVEVLALESAAAQEMQQSLMTVASTLAFQAPAGALQLLDVAAVAGDFVTKFEGNHGGWQVLDQNKMAIAPEHGAGFVRLSWEGRNIGSIRLTATVWAQAEGKPRTRGSDTVLEAPVNIVPALHLWPDKISLKSDLGPNCEDTVVSYVWSSTRAGFTIAAREENNDPCFECSCTPVTGDDFRRVAEVLNERGTTAPLTMYRVTVRVRERIGGKQMELGPFSRKVLLTSDQPDFPKNNLIVDGTVRGDIRVGSLEAEDPAKKGERDRIVLRTFPSTRGISVTIPIETNEQGSKLSVDSKNPSYLEVDLKPGAGADAGRRWDLTLTVPPNRATGRMPMDSAVILKMDSEPPRRIRIPVLGKATLSADGR